MAKRRNRLFDGAWVKDVLHPHLLYRRVAASTIVLVRHDKAYSLARITDEIDESFGHIDFRCCTKPTLYHAAYLHGWKTKEVAMRELHKRLK